MPEELLHYYNEQLSYLRKQGKAFAEAYPKIAANLNFGTDSCDDPLVNRLLEGFAFLTGRIQHNIDQGNRTITENLIRLFYPHFERSIPAFTLIQFQPKNQLEQTLIIPKHSLLRTKVNSHDYTFRTGYPVQLTPLDLININWTRNFSKPPIKISPEIKSCLSFTLQPLKLDTSTTKLNLKTIRVHINLENHLAFSLYEILHTKLEAIMLTIDDRSTSQKILANTHLKLVGFSDQEILLPFPKNSNKTYGLLTEFFAYQKKFLFFDIEGLDTLNYAEEFTQLTVKLYLKATHSECEKAIDNNSLLLNCSPIINLFPWQAEPIRIDNSQIEYQIVADNLMPISQIETYSVEEIDISSNERDGNKFSASEYFGKSYSMLENDSHLYWQIRFKKCWELGEHHLAGSEAFVTFSSEKEKIPSKDLIAVPKLLCTNRSSTSNISFSDENPKFQLPAEINEHIANIKTLIPITKPYYREKSIAPQLELLMHIQLNKFGYDNQLDPTLSLKNTLNIYDFNNTNQLLINKGISKISIIPIIARNPETLKQRYCKGIEYRLTIDEQYFTENTMLLFAEVLFCFLQQLCSINSFVQLVLESHQRGVIKQWQPALGTQKIL